jgi:hypothetical protein
MFMLETAIVLQLQNHLYFVYTLAARTAILLSAHCHLYCLTAATMLLTGSLQYVQ